MNQGLSITDAILSIAALTLLIIFVILATNHYSEPDRERQRGFISEVKTYPGEARWTEDFGPIDERQTTGER